ncbi:MAG: zinc ABC transporter substrate-binding protein [Nitrospinae bacterium]|nr:zinc ABC transporter substrate-binding protein [Nitrospinota bacterium]
MKAFFKKSIIAFVLTQILISPNKSWAQPYLVFVSIAPQKYFVERIGGKEVEVEVMVKSGESPATFNPNPKKMRRLANAKLYFSIGVPFERIWISRIKAIQPDLKFVPLNKINIGSGHSHSEHHSHEESDPHIWTSPPLAKKIAAEISAALSALKPEKAEFFQENYNALVQDLDALDQEIREIIATGKTRSFMVFHPAWSYFAETYGLQQISIEHQGKEPGPRALQEIIRKGKQLKIKVIFVQKQFGLSIAQKVAKMIGATVQEMDPLSENYLDNMRKTAKAISGANH